MSQCLHKHCTLCGEYNLEAGTFVAWQCDECGQITRRDVSIDDLYRRDLPAIDYAAAEAVVSALGVRAAPERVEQATVTFLAGAIRR